MSWIPNFFKELDLRTVLLRSMTVYMVFVVFTVIFAHVAAVIVPVWGLAERFIAPVRSGLEFLDEHWRAALMVVAPFFIPEAVDLIRRIRQIGLGEGRVIDFREQGVREKPQTPASTERK